MDDGRHDIRLPPGYIPNPSHALLNEPVENDGDEFSSPGKVSEAYKNAVRIVHRLAARPPCPFNPEDPSLNTTTL